MGLNTRSCLCIAFFSLAVACGPAWADNPHAPAAARPAVQNWKYDPATYLNDLRTPITPAPPVRPYNFSVAWEHVQAIPLELAGLTAAWVLVGTQQWHWGSTSFHFHTEGWFGSSTPYGGADKVGHAWTAHVLADFLTWRLQSRGFNTYEAAISGSLLSGLAMATIELGDGFSKNYGASYEDLIADFAGAGFAFLRNTVPGLRDKLDFRMQYMPTSQDDSGGVGDYSGKKFLLALKLSGFDQFKDTPLRYAELQAGYFTRGYMYWERAENLPRTRTPYVGVGLNLSELLFPRKQDPSLAEAVGQRVLEYIQVPYTYIATDNSR
jgi:hypothetical protein